MDAETRFLLAEKEVKHKGKEIKVAVFAFITGLMWGIIIHSFYIGS